MVSEIDSYKPIIEETLRKFDCKLPMGSYGIAYHKIYVDGSGSPSDYEFNEADEKFLQLLQVNANQLGTLRYENLFPETKETKFDWVSTLGQAAISDGRAKFYCYSKLLDKWFSIFSFGPKKGYAFFIFEDISNAKALEIQENLKKVKLSVTDEE